ncbi:MAG: hypothetical protein AUK24_05835 [Syntrophaceae bacterium CG2_30_49_12]|nr:MAG: hypothetical protein AUK24_05835 [Syntrophaceae bacterium CG2_30_49_12]PJC73991.1 MAG: hypothetical protein CO012_07620 [Syntrophobacterales bacterium CG_4_8_14_3_um_filter_49_14]
MPIKRYLFNDLAKHLPKKEMSLIVGPRQAGKTTLSHQGTKARRIDMNFSTLSEKEEGIARKIVDAAYTVHKILDQEGYSKNNYMILVSWCLSG